MFLSIATAQKVRRKLPTPALNTCSEPFRFMTPLSSVHFHLVLTCDTWLRTQLAVARTSTTRRGDSHLLKLADHQVAGLGVIVIVVICTAQDAQFRGQVQTA